MDTILEEGAYEKIRKALDSNGAGVIEIPAEDDIIIFVWKARVELSLVFNKFMELREKMDLHGKGSFVNGRENPFDASGAEIHFAVFRPKKSENQ